MNLLLFFWYAFYPPSQKAANFSWRMNSERVSAKAVLAMGRIALFIANMISVGGCASAGFAEDGALVPPTSVGGVPMREAASRPPQSCQRLLTNPCFFSLPFLAGHTSGVPGIFPQ